MIWIISYLKHPGKYAFEIEIFHHVLCIGTMYMPLFQTELMYLSSPISLMPLQFSKAAKWPYFLIDGWFLQRRLLRLHLGTKGWLYYFQPVRRTRSKISSPQELNICSMYFGMKIYSQVSFLKLCGLMLLLWYCSNILHNLAARNQNSSEIFL